MNRRIILAAAVLLMAAPPASAMSITSNTTWSGTVRVKREVVVEKGVTLTIMPGTTVTFAPGRPDQAGLADTGLLVKGAIVAEGRPGARITFTSGAARPRPGDWGEIRIFASKGSSVSQCDFSCGGWGLHIHDSVMKVTGCTFRYNRFGGIRGKGMGLEVSGCLLTGLDIGIRYWQGSPTIRGCTITANRTGIFFRQGCEGAVVKANNIFGNSDYDFKLGEAQTADVDLTGNWWGSADAGRIRKKIFDKARDNYIGRALIEPVLAGRAEAP